MGKKKSNDSATSQKAARQDANNFGAREENHFKNNTPKQSSSSNQERYDRRIHDSKDYGSLKVVLFYCSLIVFMPVLTFFVLKAFLLERLFTLTEIHSNIYAAAGAVIALHFALGVYIYRAYFSDSQSTDKKTN